MRQIRTKRLFLSGIVYRIHVIIAQSLFFFILTGEWQWAVSTSVIWNLVSTCLYYNYHYWFARLLKLGKEGLK